LLKCVHKFFSWNFLLFKRTKYIPGWIKTLITTKKRKKNWWETPSVSARNRMRPWKLGYVSDASLSCSPNSSVLSKFHCPRDWNVWHEHQICKISTFILLGIQHRYNLSILFSKTLPLHCEMLAGAIAGLCQVSYSNVCIVEIYCFS
jgi:hypothetical protein